MADGRHEAERLGRTSFTLAQEIRKPDGAVAADASIVLVTIDPRTRKPCVVPLELALGGGGGWLKAGGRRHDSKLRSMLRSLLRSRIGGIGFAGRSPDPWPAG